VYYKRNDDPWVPLGSIDVPESLGTLYGWDDENATDIHPSVEGKVLLEQPKGGGGCLMNPTSSFGVEWLILLLLLVGCRRRLRSKHDSLKESLLIQRGLNGPPSIYALSISTVPRLGSECRRRLPKHEPAQERHPGLLVLFLPHHLCLYRLGS
jgi:hypothetical protein